MNKIIFTINRIFSIFKRIINWICRHWSSLRKILVILLILGGLVYQLLLPDTQKKINEYSTQVILEHEQKAISLKNSGNLSDAIDSYKSAIAMMLSQKKLSYFDMDDNIQYRIYKNTALLILDYSKSNKLTPEQGKMLSIITEQLNKYYKKPGYDPELNKILSDIILLQKNL